MEQEEEMNTKDFLKTKKQFMENIQTMSDIIKLAMFGRPEIEMVTLRLIKQIHINASWHSNPESPLIYIFSKN